MAMHPQALPSSLPPSAVEYGGDEISAIVLDPGTAWTRAGFAGEDTPKSVVPTDYGVVEGAGENRYYYGDNEVHTPRPRMEIQNPMEHGVVADWDAAPRVWRHAITSRLTANLSEHPLLITEPAWNSQKNREKTIEVAFEDFDVPAFYLAKSAVTAGFASGKATGLIVDIGASNLSITPIHDGLVLRKGVSRTPLGGNFMSSQIRAILDASNIPLIPHYQVVSKTPVEPLSPARAVLRTFSDDEAPTASFRAFEQERTLTEFKESTCQVWTGPGPLPSQENAMMNGLSGRPFEFPDGYNQLFTLDRFRVTEGIFSPNSVSHPSGAPTPMGFRELLLTSMKDVDVELKQHILNNVVVTGAASLVYGCTDRINAELGMAFPGPRVRVMAAGNSVERRYASWLGGSILASLGSFHQLWISRKEYDEHGAGIVEKRCK